MLRFEKTSRPRKNPLQIPKSPNTNPNNQCIVVFHHSHLVQFLTYQMSKHQPVVRSPTKLRKAGTFSSPNSSGVLSSADNVSAYALLHPESKCAPRVPVSTIRKAQPPVLVDEYAPPPPLPTAPHLEASSLTPRQLLECELIRKMQSLKRLQLESEHSQRLYGATSVQLKAKQAANRREARQVVESVRAVRKNLEGINVPT